MTGIVKQHTVEDFTRGNAFFMPTTANIFLLLSLTSNPNHFSFSCYLALSFQQRCNFLRSIRSQSRMSAFEICSFFFFSEIDPDESLRTDTSAAVQMNSTAQILLCNPYICDGKHSKLLSTDQIELVLSEYTSLNHIGFNFAALIVCEPKISFEIGYLARAIAEPAVSLPVNRAHLITFQENIKAMLERVLNFDDDKALVHYYQLYLDQCGAFFEVSKFDIRFVRSKMLGVLMIQILRRRIQSVSIICLP